MPTVLLSAIVLLGYFGFRYFVVQLMPSAGSVGLALLAILAAIATFFSPCVFPLIPAGLGLSAGTTAQERWRKAVGAAAGVISFAILLALAISALGAAFGASLGITSATPNPYVRGLRIVAGVVLMTLASLHLTGRMRVFHSFAGGAERVAARRHGDAFMYGFFYTLLGVGCGGPILAGLMTVALTGGGAFTAFWSVALYALVMGALMLLVVGILGKMSGSFSASGATLARLQRISGMALLLVGFYLVVSSVYLVAFRRALFP